MTAKAKTTTKKNDETVETVEELKEAAQKKFDDTMEKASAKLAKAEASGSKSINNRFKARKEFKATKRAARKELNSTGIVKQCLAWTTLFMVLGATFFFGNQFFNGEKSSLTAGNMDSIGD